MRVSSRLTLVTVTLPQRSAMLAEQLGSVATQTCAPAAHIIVRDDGRGFVDTINRAVSMVDTQYFCLVDDDDLLLNNHVETLDDNLTAEVVWTWTEVVGRDWSPNTGYKPGALQTHNYIPSNHAMLKERFTAAGGYRHNTSKPPDHDLLARLETAGATFRNIPTVTWIYRFHGDNMTYWNPNGD